MCRVTVGLPFYNNEATLEAAIRSVFAQSYQDWELILVDDGSSDGSLAIARAVGDPRVRVISDGSRKGLAARLNQVAELADSEYVARMDADDLMHPDRLERQVVFLDRHPEVDVVGTGMYSIDDEYHVRGIRRAMDFRGSATAVLSRAILAHPTVMGRVAWVKANKYDSSYVRAEDHELWCRTFRTSVFAAINDPLYFYREGRFNLRKYLQSAACDRRILRRYGPELVGVTVTWALIARSYVKSAVYWAFNSIGAVDVLINKRNCSISPALVGEAERCLTEILETQVPGLPESFACVHRGG